MNKAILRFVLVIAFMPALAVAGSPFDGTWKYDLSKTIHSKKPSVFLLQDGIYESKTEIPPVKVKADGSDQPVSGDPYVDTVAVQIVSDHQIKVTGKKNGKERYSLTQTVSSDGKTMAITESDNTANNGGPPVIWKVESTRVAEGPAGSHAISGSWEESRLEGSDNGILFTFKVDGDQISYSEPTGESYTAKLGGTDAPYHGDPGITSVSVKMLGKDTLEITTKRDDKVIGVSTMTAAAGGKAIKEVYENRLEDRKFEYVAVKQPAATPEPQSAALLTYSGHTGDVYSVAIAPDGRTALSGSADKTLKLWDLAGGKELRTFRSHTDSVVSVAISPDGRTALSGSSDRTLKLWDLATGKEIRTLAGNCDFVFRIAFLPDSRTALSSDGDKVLKLWDLQTGKVLKTFGGHAGRIWGLSISPDGRTALSGSQDKTLKLWDLTSGKEIRTFSGHDGLVYSTAFCPDGQTALSASDDGTVKLWDLSTGKELRTHPGGSEAVFSAAITPDGQSAVSAGSSGIVRLWDLSTDRELGTFSGHHGAVLSLAISPDGKTALSGAGDGTLRLWDLRSGPAQDALAARVAEAREKLKGTAGDPDALMTVGEWCAARGMDRQAIDALTRARDAGAAVSPGVMARCYWRLGQLDEARKEFQAALDHSQEAAERASLQSCIAAIDAEPQRQREHQTALDVRKLEDQAEYELAIGRPQEALAHLATASANDPYDTDLVGHVAAMQVWFGRNSEASETARRAIQRAAGTSSPTEAERAAKCALIAPCGDKALLDAAVALARQAAETGRADPFFPYYQTTLGMAEYRSGHYAAADEVLSQAAVNAKDIAGLAAQGAFYRAMCLYQEGKTDGATKVAADAASKMLPLPPEENHLGTDLNPFGQWVAYKEAKALLGVDIAPPRDPERETAARAEMEQTAGYQLGRRGFLKEAIEHLDKARQLNENDHWPWYEEGCVLAYSGDTDAYGKHCRSMLEKFSGSNVTVVLDRTTKAALLLPQGGDPKQLLALADRVLSEGANTPYGRYFHLLKSLALYRNGEFQTCIDEAQNCKRLGGEQTATVAATADLLMAMSHQRLGSADQAHADLERAQQLINSELPIPNEQQPISQEFRLEDWLVCRTLAREAESLISGGATKQ